MTVCPIHNIEHSAEFPCEQFEEYSRRAHKLNHGVDRADHVNLRDGITTDVDGRILSVREDTKIPVEPFDPFGEREEQDVLVQLPDVGDNQDTIDFWRNAQRRAPEDDQSDPSVTQCALRSRVVTFVVGQLKTCVRGAQRRIAGVLSLEF